MSEEKKRKNVGGVIDEAKGRAKEAFGALADDKDTKREGQLDRVAGDAKDKISEAIDGVRDGVESLLKKKDEKK